MINKDSKILVTGVKGQLGFDVVNELTKRGFFNVKGIDIQDLDITDEKAVDKYITDFKPAVVMHNAAWTAVDKAEQFEEKVYQVNSYGTRNIARACKKVDAKMVYISTDYVFDGKGTTPFEVDSPKNGLSIYGKSKALGETFVQEALDKYFIVRISWAFGINGANFVRTMLKVGATHDSLNVVNDQIGSPTYTFDLARLLVDMIETDKYGIYHATNEGFCSWADFAKAIFEVAHMKTTVNPVTSEEYKKLAPNQAERPLNSRMSKNSLIKAGFKPLPTWQDALHRYIDELKKKNLIPLRVLVTGANGYIGPHVVNELKKLGHVVIACDISDIKVDADYKINASIFDEQINPLEFYKYPDVIIHLAWRNGFNHSAESHLGDLDNHYRFLKSMIKCGVKNIAVMGTMHEVGYFEGKIDENTPCNPLSNYGKAKNQLREMMFNLKKEYDFNLYWIRAFYITGCDENNHSIFTKLLDAEKAGKEKFPFTSGKNKFDFIDIDELAKYIAMISTQQKVSGIINACSGKAISLAEMVEKFISNNNLKIKLDYGAFPDRPYDSPEIYGDISKLSLILKDYENRGSC